MARRRVVQSSDDSDGCSDTMSDHGGNIIEMESQNVDEAEVAKSDSSSESASDDGSHNDNELIDLEVGKSKSDINFGNSRRGSAMFDLEAEEGNEDSEIEEFDPDEPTFDKFRMLPPELRRRVWELFCPDIRKRSRILVFQMEWDENSTSNFGYDDPRIADQHPAGHWTFTEGLPLSDQSEALRSMAAVHQESRDIVTKAFPDTLAFYAGSGDAELRFNRNSDIVVFNRVEMSFPPENPPPNPPNDGFLDKLKHVGFVREDEDDQDIDFPSNLKDFLKLAPAVETVYLARLDFELRTNKIRWCGSQLAKSYYIKTWPKVHGLGEYAEWMYSWPDLDAPNVNGAIEVSAHEDLYDWGIPKAIRFAPMVVFEFEGGMKKFRELCEYNERGVLAPESEDEDEDDEGTNSDSDDDENDYESEGIDDADIGSDHYSSEDELIPQALHEVDSEGDDEVVEITSPQEQAVGNFSSPEPDSISEPEDIQPIITRKRRVVEDSDDEDAEPSTKRIRTGAVVLSSDDEDKKPQRSRSRQPQVVSSDSESSSDEDDEPVKLSLVQRLRQGREQIPSDESHDNSEELDEEEGSEEDSEDEDRLIDNMAEDMYGEGEEQSEDENEDEAW